MQPTGHVSVIIRFLARSIDCNSGLSVDRRLMTRLFIYGTNHHIKVRNRTSNFDRVSLLGFFGKEDPVRLSLGDRRRRKKIIKSFVKSFTTLKRSRPGK